MIASASGCHRSNRLSTNTRVKDVIINTIVITVAFFERKRLDFSSLGSTSILISCFLAAFLFMRYFGIHLLDEARTAKHRSQHEHLYTRIHGVWYNFANFNHPGGPIALSLAKGRDATVLFESHHLLSKKDMSKILSKYRVDASVAKHLSTIDPRDDGAHYQWDNFHNDAFVEDLKELLWSYFGVIAQQNNCSLYQAAKATKERWSLLGILFLGVITVLPHYTKGEWWTMFVLPPLAWVLIANYWHDCLHFSLSSDWQTNASLPYLIPLLSSPWLWYHQHVIGHHAYTNIGMKDPDIAHAPQLKREHVSIQWKKRHQNQATFGRFVMLWSIATNLGMNFLGDVKTNIKHSFNNVVGYNKLSRLRLALHCIGRIIYLYITVAWPFFVFPLKKAAIWTIVSNVLFSCCFMINSQINHLTTNTSNASDPNFLKHQVITAQNFGVNSAICTLLSGGLNFQIEHHLFPFVCHAHLPHLAPKVRALCIKHKVPYNQAQGYKDAFEKHFQHTVELSKPTPHPEGQ